MEAESAVQLGVDLQRVVRSRKDLESALAGVTAQLYRELVGPDGERACVLARGYTTSTFEALDPVRADFLRAAHGSEPEAEMRCLALVASTGDEADWNDPARSRGHLAIPLPSREGVASLPMVAQLFRELGLDIGALLARDRKLMVDMARSYNVFYVAEAAGSPHVPAQETFVAPFGIRSVIGFGGQLGSGELFAVILFTRVHVPRKNAAMFRVVAVAVRDALRELV